jgi:alpha-D-ribose 1-methylphosphonate 5-triphosphate diphosphatase PhnM
MMNHLAKASLADRHDASAESGAIASARIEAGRMLPSAMALKTVVGKGGPSRGNQLDATSPAETAGLIDGGAISVGTKASRSRVHRAAQNWPMLRMVWRPRWRVS